MEIDERFAFITASDGTRFQVLKYEPDQETGVLVPVDWDESATASLYFEYIN